MATSSDPTATPTATQATGASSSASLNNLNNSQQITVLSDLPKFRGRQRPGDPGLVYNTIDTSAGDAQNIIQHFVGCDPDYERIRSAFLACYPVVSRTDLKFASRMTLQVKIDKPSVVLGMASLQEHTKGLVETFLNLQTTKNTGCTHNTTLRDTKGVGQQEIKVTQLLQVFLIKILSAAQLSDNIYDKTLILGIETAPQEHMTHTIRIVRVYVRAAT